MRQPCTGRLNAAEPATSPLCNACVHALYGKVYQRPMPESAARAVRRGAA